MNDRLSDPDSEASPVLRAALKQARADLPSAEVLARMAARLPVGLPTAPDAVGAAGAGGSAGAEGSTSGAGSAGAGALGAKLVLGGGLVAALVGGGALFWWVGAVATEDAVVVTAPEAAAAEARGAPEARGGPEARGAPEAAAAPEAPVVAAEPAAAEPGDSLAAELRLLRGAQEAQLRGEAKEALAQAEAHLLQHPAGQLAQEREVVAIQALVSLGRSGEARVRADAFRARWPGSAHLRRLDVILEDPAPR